jgi:hypothetical protein
VLADDAHGVVETEAEALARGLGGEEGLEDAVLQLGRDAGAGVPDFDQQHIGFESTGEFEFAIVSKGVERVFNEGGPYLVEFAAVGADAGQVGFVVALIFTLFMRDWSICTVASRPAGTSTSRMGGAVHVGVGLHGADEVEDAGGGVDERVDRARGAEKRAKYCSVMQVASSPMMARTSSRSGTVTPSSAS